MGETRRMDCRPAIRKSYQESLPQYVYHVRMSNAIEIVLPLRQGEFRCEDIGHPAYIPKSAADPRPNGPYYIDDTCECGTELQLHPDNDGLDKKWYDEWWCPECDNGVHMDWPENRVDRLEEAIRDVKNGNFATKEEIEQAFDTDGE